jgi:hypothetical protein
MQQTVSILDIFGVKFLFKHKNIPKKLFDFCPKLIELNFPVITERNYILCE